jgi:hypothetical protein
MKKVVLMSIILLSAPALANDFCTQRVVKKCDISGINCEIVVVCD